MPISLRVNEQEMSIIKSYANLRGTTVSDTVREAILEKIENEFDITIYKKAMKKHQKNPETYSHEEMLKKLDIH